MPGIIDSEEALGLCQRKIWDESHAMSGVEGEWEDVAAEVHGESLAPRLSLEQQCVHLSLKSLGTWGKVKCCGQDGAGGGCQDGGFVIQRLRQCS